MDGPFRFGEVHQRSPPLLRTLMRKIRKDNGPWLSPALRHRSLGKRLGSFRPTSERDREVAGNSRGTLPGTRAGSSPHETERNISRTPARTSRPVSRSPTATHSGPSPANENRMYVSLSGKWREASWLRPRWSSRLLPISRLRIRE